MFSKTNLQEYYNCIKKTNKKQAESYKSKNYKQRKSNNK